MSMSKICDHCKMDISIRNPSGFCDHLYYPDNCTECYTKGSPCFEVEEKERPSLKERVQKYDPK